MIYPAQTYNFLTRRLSRAMLTIIWITVGFAIFYAIFAPVASIAVSSTRDEDTLLGFLSILLVISTVVALVSLVFFIIYFVRLYDFKNNVEGKDRTNTKLLITAIWIQIIIPVVSSLLLIIAFISSDFSIEYLKDADDLEDALEGLYDIGVVASIAYIISIIGSLTALVLQLIGYAGLGNSQTLFCETAAGFKKIFMSYIWILIGSGAFLLIFALAYATEVPGIILIGVLAFLVISIVALVKYIKGWYLVGHPAPQEADPIPIQ